MSKTTLFFTAIPVLLIVTLVYRPWFVNASIIGGDWPYFFDETIQALPLFPPGWSAAHGNGLGGVIPGYFLDQYLYFTAFLSSHVLHIPWEVGHKVFWFGTFLTLSIFSSMYLVKIVFFQAKLWQIILAPIIFTTNTYILMVVGGGQMGIALAYSTTPLVLASFIKLIGFISFNNEFKIQNSKFKITIQNSKLLKRSIIAGLVLGVQVMFDPRIAYLSMIAVVVYYLIDKFQISNFNPFDKLRVDAERSRSIKFQIVAILYIFVIPGIIAVLLHASWIVPLLFSGHNPIEDLGSAIPTVAGLRFFSFASFSQTLSFLHPNWPENIFGKTYFMKPEFLLIPILAFSGILFISNIKNQISKIQIKNKKFYYSSEAQAESRSLSEGSSRQDGYHTVTRQARTIIYFCLLGLLGAFLAKGVNPPFGEVNTWLFQYFPGMNMFRDPTKFYLLVTLSYSVLIPFSVYSIYSWLSAKCKVQSAKLQFKVKSYLPNLLLLFAICYLLFLIRPAILGQLGGTFKSHAVPEEYIKLKELIHTQPDFFRTLWIPRRQRFTFVSNIHPAIEAMPLFEATNSSQIVSRLEGSESQRLLEDLSVKYVIIPYDSIGEIFLRDRKYDDKQRIDLEKQLDNIGWLKKIKTGKIAIYETYSYKDRFWLDRGGKISYKMVSPTRYLAEVSTSTSFSSLIFSENYSPYWTARIGEEYINSKKTKDGLNSFGFNKVGKYNVEVFYAQDQYYWYGRVISIGDFLLLVLILFFLRVHSP